MHPKKPILLSGRLLARNTVFNLAGQISPALVAIFSVPVLLRAIGVDRFALLTFVWMIIGYFGICDLGLNRALTHAVAECLGRGARDEIREVIQTATAAVAVLSAAAVLMLCALAPWVVHHVLKIPQALQGEALYACIILGLSIPAALLSTASRGVLEAYQRFGTANAIRVPVGMSNFLGPLLVLPFSHSLVPVVGVIAFNRYLGMFAMVFYATKVSATPFRPRFSRHVLKKLFSYSSWVTVSNVVGPLQTIADRVVIGAVLPIAAIAYYATPMEVMTKVSVISISLAGVLFPAFAALNAEPQRASALFARGMKWTFLLVLPAILTAIAFAPEALRLWLGANFAVHTVQILRWEAVAVFGYCLIHLPFAIIQGSGRPDLTAKLQALETPVYFGLLYALTVHFGATGAAVAWTLRTCFEAVACFLLVRRFTPANTVPVGKAAALFGASLLACGAIGSLGPLQSRIIAWSIAMVVHVVGVWKLMFDDADRSMIRLHRALAPERPVPIEYDAAVSAVGSDA
jgi:O-antigen/teichoic acid export membrane protein